MTIKAERILLPRIEKSGCFGCGPDNPRGLRMTFYAVGGTIRSDVILNKHHMGWENIAHGGIISTILDEIMGWTVIAYKRAFFVTRKMEVQYLRPVELDTALTVVGEIESDFAPKGCSTKGTLLDAQGKKLAEAWAEMRYLSVKRLPMLPEHYRKGMVELFERMRELLE